MNAVPGFHIQNFGCRATQADGASLVHQFEQLGLSRSSPDLADVVVLNTCTVTAAADQEARYAIRRVQRHNPGAQVIVTGCYAQRAPQEIAALPGVSAVIGNSHKHQLAEIVLAQARLTQTSFVPVSALANRQRPFSACPERSQKTDDATPVHVSDIFAHTELLAAPFFEFASASERTRPNLKVQDGCDNRCSFCVIPSVRGHSRSLPLDRILAEVRFLVGSGHRELVLSGINLGRWGRDLTGEPLTTGDRRLTSLIRAILSQTSLEKLRISSVEPMDWSREFISLVASSPRIAKHAHLPLQSGSDSVLRRMHRKYRPWHYREKIELIHATIPTAAIGADVMSGFPGETDAEFDQTLRLIDDLPFTYLHVFPYSSRPGTPAAAMPHQVSPRIVRERHRILCDLAAAKHHAFMLRFIGTSLDAITLHSPAVGDPAFAETDAGFTEALTDNYLKLRLKGRHAPNRWLRVHIESVGEGSLAGFVL